MLLDLCVYKNLIFLVISVCFTVAKIKFFLRYRYLKYGNRKKMALDIKVSDVVCLLYLTRLYWIFVSPKLIKVFYLCVQKNKIWSYIVAFANFINGILTYCHRETIPLVIKCSFGSLGKLRSPKFPHLSGWINQSFHFLHK